MKSIIYFITLIIVFTAISCSNDSESDLNPPPPNTVVTYTTNVSSIINANCISCHGVTPTNSAPMSLATYQNVRDAILNRGLIDRISRGQGTTGMMPQGGSRLPESSINTIIKWQADGFIN